MGRLIRLLISYNLSNFLYEWNIQQTWIILFATSYFRTFFHMNHIFLFVHSYMFRTLFSNSISPELSKAAGMWHLVQSYLITFLAQTINKFLYQPDVYHMKSAICRVCKSWFKIVGTITIWLLRLLIRIQVIALKHIF